RPRRRALRRGRPRPARDGAGAAGGGGARGGGRRVGVRGVHGGGRGGAGRGAAAVRALVPRRLHRPLAADPEQLPDVPGGATSGGRGGEAAAACRLVAAGGVLHDACRHVALLIIKLATSRWTCVTA